MGTNITALLIGMLFFGSLITGAAMFSNQIIGMYNPSQVTDVTVFSQLQNTSDITGSSQEKLTSQGATTISAADVFLTGGWTALTTVISLPGNIGDILFAIGQPQDQGGIGFEIPAWFVGLIVGAASIFIVYRIVGIATRSETGGV